MSWKFVQLNTYSALVNARVMNLFSQKQSSSHQSYQSKKILSSTTNQSQNLEYFLSIYQEKELVSFNPTKSDLNGQSIPKREIPKKPRKIPGLLGVESIAFLEPTMSNSF